MNDATKLSTLRRLIPFLRPYTGTIGLALVALAVAAVVTLMLPAAVRRLIDLDFNSVNQAAIDHYFLELFVLTLVFALFAALRFYLVSWLGERVIADIRGTVYRHVIRMSPSFFEATRTGEVLSRLIADTTLVQSLVGAGLSMTLRGSFLFIGGLIMLVFTSARLTGMLVLLIPLVVIPLVWFGRRVRKLSRASQDRIADTGAMAEESLNAVQTLQAFTMEDTQGQRFSEVVEAAFATAVRRAQARAWFSGTTVLVLFGAIIYVLRIGAEAVMEGQTSAGELGQFVLYALIVALSTTMLSEVWGEVQRAAGAMERLMELLNARSDITTPSHPVAIPPMRAGKIDFDDVSFRYPSRPSQWALRHFSFKIEAGETVALVGPSGAGKSTVFQLLLRFYDPQAGRVMLGGTDIARADLTQLRTHIGIVPQESVIFATSVMENIRYGRQNATDAEVIAAAKAALVDEFVDHLEDGYASFLGERGVRLSGGQRQRIAVARAILKDSPVMLLDEATSALDAHSERLVQEALDHLLQNRTTLVIAHRLATVLKADRIVVMDKGQIVAVGTHQQLLKQEGLYAQLAALQFVHAGESVGEY